MNKLIISAFLLLFSAGLSAQDKRLAGIDTFVTRVLKEWKAVGVSVTIVEKNKVLMSRGYGYRDLEKKLPVTDETLFAIGSCTKAFTSSLLGLLSQDGKLDFDKPVYNYLPDLRFYNEALSEHITVKDMMSHRTGLPRHDLAWYGAPAQRDSLVYRIRYFENSAPLRSVWQYNNFMFLAQGYLAEKISGKKWEDLLAERIFTPLGMTYSSPYIAAMEKSSNASTGYRVIKDSLITKMKYISIDAMGPAGSINSNGRDMAKWVISWINGGKYNGKEVLPAAYVTQAISSQMVVAPGLPSKEVSDVFMANYGFAWFLASYRGHYRVEHGGNIDGFSASTSFYPSDSIGIIVLVNQNSSTLPAIIRNTITDKLLGLPYRDWSGLQMAQYKKNVAAAKQKRSADSTNRKLGTRPSHALAEYAGVYKNPGYGTIVISKNGDSLTANYNRLNLTLKHYHYEIFNAIPIEEGMDTNEDDALKIVFGMNKKGDIETLKIALESSVKDIEFVKQMDTIRLSKAELEKYTGDYDLNGAVVRIYIKGENTLMAVVPGQPEYELAGIAKDEFGIKVASGYSIKFDVNEKNITTSLSFIQPNGIFKAIKK
jgi:CubicO group peptidase (beta-lactamase class C family)